MSADTPQGSPIPRLAHALIELVRRCPQGSPERLAAEEMLQDHAAIAEYIERQNEQLRELNESALRAHEETNRLNRLIPSAVREAERRQA